MESDPKVLRLQAAVDDCYRRRFERTYMRTQLRSYFHRASARFQMAQAKRQRAEEIEAHSGVGKRRGK